MEKHARLWERFAAWCARAVLWLGAALLAVLSAFSLYSTGTISRAEKAIYARDPIILNLLLLAAVLGLCALVRKRASRPISPRFVRAAECAMLCFVGLVGVAWVWGVKTIPATDSQKLVSMAICAAQNDFSAMPSDYFIYYPFQLGFVAALEAFIRLFGAENIWRFGYVNVVSLLLFYLAIVRVTERVFQKPVVTLGTVCLLAGFLQPALFSTFVYGNLLGAALAAWGAYFTVAFLQSGKGKWLIAAVTLVALGVVFKQNGWIVAIACAIVLILYALGQRRAVAVAAALAIVSLPALLSNGVCAMYEARAGASFGSGLPQTYWLAIGLSDGDMAPGWWNEYSLHLFDGTPPVETIMRTVRADIAQRVQALLANPAYAARFYLNKLRSVWNEVTYQSIWVSLIRDTIVHPPAYIQAIYYNTPGDVLLFWFDKHVQLLFCLACAGAALLAGRRGSGRKTVAPGDGLSASLLLLIVIGGAMYHLIFEAKSQYVILYVPMLAPYAAYGLDRLTAAACRGRAPRLSKG